MFVCSVCLVKIFQFVVCDCLNIEHFGLKCASGCNYQQFLELNLYNKVQLDNLYYLGSSYSPGDIIRQLFSPVEGNIIRELEYYASESLIG